MRTCRKRESTGGYGCTDIWPMGGYTDATRALSIISTHTQDLTGCTMGYDIEVEQQELLSLPLPSARITMVSLWCTCGYQWQCHTHSAAQNHLYVPTPTELVDLFVAKVMIHRPTWLVGYNCYGFDNVALFYHCSTKALFRRIRIPQSQYGLVIDIPHVINADLYLYLDKTRRSTYTSMRLGSVAAHHGLEPKKQYATTVTGMHDLGAALEYNMHDSHLTSRLWVCTGAWTEVGALINTFRCHPWDAVRYNTGVMTSCMVAHKLLLRGMRMDWARCEHVEYEGGYVYVPRLGVYDRVDVLDFTKMTW